MRVRLVEVRGADAPQKKRVCAYARVSSDSSHQEDSLENQTATYERLIKGNPEYEFAGFLVWMFRIGIWIRIRM